MCTAARENERVTSPLYIAMREFGRDNFYVELIEECETMEDLCKSEDFWMFYYQSYVDLEGYNKQVGVGTSNFHKYIGRRTQDPVQNSLVGKKVWENYSPEIKAQRVAHLMASKKPRWPGESNGRFRHEISTDTILDLIAMNYSKLDVCVALEIYGALIDDRLFAENGQGFRWWKGYLTGIYRTRKDYKSQVIP